MAKRAEAEHPMLRIQTPGQPTRLEDLLRDRYIVGRGDPKQNIAVDFRIDGDEAVSRQHFVIQRDDGAYAVENLSSNGTLVNGKLVEDPRPLQPEDTISIGESTTLVFLKLSASERTREFAALTSSADKKEKAAGTPSKSFMQRPLVWAMLGFYVVIAVLLVGALGRKKSEAKDPGPGPYFAWVRTKPLSPPEELKGGRREIAESMWEDDLRRHGGPFTGKGGHDYRLLMEARKVLEVLGYTSVADALVSEEVVAQTLVRVLGELEDRVSTYYKEAKQSWKSGQRTRAYDFCMKIISAVPDRDAPIRRYAEQFAQHLSR
jgi:pSer/pThr/pTyr-binding forkhead associated (FHA) protein